MKALYNHTLSLIEPTKILERQICDTITVTKSDLSVRFMRLPTFNYYEKLLDKMRYWSSFDKE